MNWIPRLHRRLRPMYRSWCSRLRGKTCSNGWWRTTHLIIHRTTSTKEPRLFSWERTLSTKFWLSKLTAWTIKWCNMETQSTWTTWICLLSMMKSLCSSNTEKRSLTHLGAISSKRKSWLWKRLLLSKTWKSSGSISAKQLLVRNWRTNSNHFWWRAWSCTHLPMLPRASRTVPWSNSTLRWSAWSMALSMEMLVKFSPGSLIPIEQPCSKYGTVSIN